MKINIIDVLSVANIIVEREVETELASFQSKLGKFPVVKKEPFLLHCENYENKQMLVLGETDITLRIPCDRCLKEVLVDLHLKINRSFPIAEENSAEDGNAEDTGCLSGSMLVIDQLVYDEILVNWPMKVLCRIGCKGICKKCGMDQNHGTCSCDRTEPDPRMAAIQDIFNQFKEV